MKVRKIKKQITVDTDLLYQSLVGSMITSVGILSGKTEAENLRLFHLLKKSKEFKKCDTVMKQMNYIWNYHGTAETIPARSLLVLVYDPQNVRSPMVTLMKDNQLLPLRSNGKLEGILRSPNARTEWLYGEDGNDIIEEP